MAAAFEGVQVQRPMVNGAVDDGAATGNETKPTDRVSYSEMTSRDYYFDSYAHFGIHEVHLSRGGLLRRSPMSNPLGIRHLLGSGLERIICPNFEDKQRRVSHM